MSSRASALFAQAARRPDKAAIIFEDQRITFAQFLDRVKALAAGLAAAGFQPGHKLGLMLPNQPEFLYLEYAAFTLGGAVAPLNTFYKASEIEHVVGMCEVDWLVVDAAYLAEIRPDIRERCRALRRVYVMGLETPPDDLVRPADELRGDPTAITAPVERKPSDLALMLHTSATTGKAKGVMLSISNLDFNYDHTPGWVGLSEDVVILGALPLYNTYGLNHCINAMVVTGGTLVLLPRFHPVASLEAVQAYRCSYFPSVPAMVLKMLNHPEVGGYDTRSLKKFFIGGAAVPLP